jgi:hypothetical protein
MIMVQVPDLWKSMSLIINFARLALDWQLFATSDIWEKASEKDSRCHNRRAAAKQNLIWFIEQGIRLYLHQDKSLMPFHTVIFWAVTSCTVVISVLEQHTVSMLRANLKCHLIMW